MKRRSEHHDNGGNKIIGLGEQSTRPSDSQELQQCLEDFKRVRVLLDQSIDGIILAQVPTGELIDVNESACSQLGYSREELLHKSFMDLVLPKQSQQIRELFSTQTVPPQGIHMEALVRKRNGHSMPVEMTIRLVELSGSVNIIAVMRDITERKRVEEERLVHLQYFESMDRINRAIQGTNDLEQMMSNALDVVLSVFDCDRAFLLYPCDPEAPSWQVPMETNRAEYPGFFAQGMEINMDEESAATLRILRNSDGPVKFGPGTAHPLPEDIAERFGIRSLMAMAIYPKIGKPWQFGMHQCSYPRTWTSEEARLLQEVGRRLTDGLTSLLSHRNLQKSEKFLNNIVEHIPNMIFVKDAETLKFVRFNKAGEQLLGYSKEELIGKNDYDFFPKEEADFFTTKDREVLNNKVLIDIPEETIRNRNNIDRVLHTQKIPLLDESGKPQYLLGISEDITDRKWTEERIQQSEERFRILLMSMSDGFYLSEIIYDDNGNPCDYRYLEVNPRFEKMMGLRRDQIIGKRYKELVPVDTTQWLDNYFKVALTGESSTYEFYSNEYRMHFETYSYQPVKGQVSVFVRDITERKKLEDQLHQAQKMEAIGQLAGGVAHDFNNMLGVILGHVELSLIKTDPSQPLVAHLQEIQKAANRSSDLTRQLLAFARKQTVAPKVLDLNDTIEGMLKMLRRLIGEGITLAWLPGAKVWPVMMDPSQIDQILANLCVNARDAITDVGKISIETGNKVIDEPPGGNHPGNIPGEYVMLAVSDDGCGMTEDTLNRLFEPFFTTKELGKGTGLGLATIYGIVKQNNGLINVYSEPGMGTTFKIYLPRYAGKIDRLAEESMATKIAGGEETILLVEDDPALLKMTKAILDGLGYRVLAASTPSEAIRAGENDAGEIRLLITDVIMPEMNGLDLSKKLISFYPQIKCLFMSGYTGDVISHHGLLDEGVHFIQKPFTIHSLAANIREVLAGT